jgi:hypothetical protein
LNATYEYIFEHLSKKNPNIEELFNRWLLAKKDYGTTLTIAPREVHERFKLLNKPFNSYCKQNFIDHNFVVDQILQMSLPYSENNKQPHDKYSTGSFEGSVIEATHTFKENNRSIPPSQNSTNYNFLFNKPDQPLITNNTNNPFAGSYPDISKELYINPSNGIKTEVKPTQVNAPESKISIY